jgi:hypothetical protein
MSFEYIFWAALKYLEDRIERYYLNLFEMSSLDEILKDNVAFSIQKAQVHL